MSLFTQSDLRSLFSTLSTTPDLPSPPAYLDTLSEELLLKDHARTYLREKILDDDSEADERVPVSTLAKALDVEARTVEGLLAEGVVGWEEWAKRGGSIVTRRQFVRMRETLKEWLDTRILDLKDVMSKLEADEELLRKVLLGEQLEWEWRTAGTGLLYRRSVLEQKELEVKDALWDLEEPIEFAKLPVFDSVPAQAISKITNSVAKTHKFGWVEGKHFVPNRYREKIVQELRSRLEAEEVIERKELEQTFIKLELDDLTSVLGSAFGISPTSHIISKTFQEKLQLQADSNLASNGVAEFYDSRLSKEELSNLAKSYKSKTKGNKVRGRVVYKKDLESRWEEQAKLSADGSAQLALKEKVSLRTAERSMLQKAFAGLPEDLAAALAGDYWDTFRSEFQTRLAKHLDEAVLATMENFMSRTYTKIRVYVDAASLIEDAALKKKLMEDLEKYALETLAKESKKLDTTLNELTGEKGTPYNTLFTATPTPIDGLPALLSSKDLPLPSPAALAEKKASLLADLRTHFATTKDASLALLLYLLLAFARGSEGAVLRASGKYVPKLLKEVQKRGFVSKDEAEVLSKAKERVVAGAKGEEAARLSQELRDEWEKSENNLGEEGKDVPKSLEE